MTLNRDELDEVVDLIFFAINSYPSDKDEKRKKKFVKEIIIEAIDQAKYE